MKIRHKVNPHWYPPSATLTDEYADEVRRSTERGEREYRKAQRRLEQAENRLARARKHKAAANRKRQLAELEAIVELRRAELEEHRRQMVSVAASAEHRGKASYRPVPPQQGKGV